MRLRFETILVVMVTLGVAADVAQEVNPYIGCSYNGHCYAAAAYPFGLVQAGPGGHYYSTLSLLDTFRAAHPLYTILAPERVDGFVGTMLEHARAAGFLPIWTLWGKDNQCMIGNHSIPVIVDAYLKGFRGFDAEQAYAAIRKTRHLVDAAAVPFE